MKADLITLSERDRIATVTLNRPDRKNAINTALYVEICHTLEKLGQSSDVDVVVIKGSGDCFSVGEDLQELASDDDRGALAHWRRTYRSFVHVTWHLPKMVLAEVRGEAFGVGCELALLADVTFADPSAKFGHPEMAHGLLSPTVWPWLAGPKIAKEYLSSARIMRAEEAMRVRLINKVFAPDQLSAEIEALARDFSSMPPGAAVANKRRLNWSHRDISRTLLDDLSYGLDFQWQVENRAVDEAFYSSVRDQGFDAALKNRNARYRKS
jgi:enoyl-CoA hydratase/carnithine racemase